MCIRDRNGIRYNSRALRRYASCDLLSLSRQYDPLPIIARCCGNESKRAARVDCGLNGSTIGNDQRRLHMRTLITDIAFLMMGDAIRQELKDAYVVVDDNIIMAIGTGAPVLDI